MKQQLITEAKRMQKLAGILTENEEWEDFIHSDELGWLEVTIEEIIDEQNLDVSYRSDFDIAFDEAITRLKTEQPQLDFNLIQKYKENIFKG